MEPQSKHGVTYLTDYYALLDVRRDADLRIIKFAFHHQLFLYHEDLYAHLAGEARQMAAQRTLVLNEAMATLGNVEKRKEYDAKLAAWQGPLSTDGVPIVDPVRSYFSMSALMGEERRDEISRMIQDALKHTAQYDPITFGIIETLYREASPPSEEIRHSYQEQLEKREHYFEILEEIAWEELGIVNARAVRSHVSITHDQETEGKIAVVRDGLKFEVAKLVRMIAAGEVKALPTGEDDDPSALVATNPHEAVERYYGAALVIFDAMTDNVRSAAKEVVQTVQKRLDTMAWRYEPAQTEFFPRLAVRICAREHFIWFEMYLEGKRVVAENRGGQEALRRLSDSEAAREWIASGANIIMCEALQGIDPHNQLQYIATAHFKRFVPEESGTGE